MRHAGRARISAAERAGVDAGDDDAFEDAHPRLVELFGDLAQHRVAQPRGPRVDPEQPGLVAARAGQVLAQHAVEPRDWVGARGDRLLEPQDVGLGGVPQRRREQLVLRREVVVDQAGADAECVGDVGDTGVRRGPVRARPPTRRRGSPGGADRARCGAANGMMRVVRAGTRQRNAQDRARRVTRRAAGAGARRPARARSRAHRRPSSPPSYVRCTASHISRSCSTTRRVAS